jgi:hypothetical protein
MKRESPMPWLSLMNHTKLENKKGNLQFGYKEVLNKSLSESTLF